MIKVAISYRVLQSWRIPVFEYLGFSDNIDLIVYYADDFIGTKVKSFTGNTQFKTKKLPSKNFKIKTKNGYAYIPYNPTLWSELKSFNPDVVIVEGASNLLNNIISFIYAKKNNKKIIQWGLGEIEGRKKSFHRKIADLFFNSVERNSDAAIAYSSFGANYYKNIGLREDAIFTAVNVVDTKMRLEIFKKFCFTNNLFYPSPVPNYNNILFIGALSENKNVDVLIKSLSILIRKFNHKKISLTIVGDGTLRSDLENLVQELDIQDYISFEGHQNDVSSYFYKASIMVLPGLGGLAISDSLIHGVPVICTIGDGCEKDLVNDGSNGVFIRNMNVEALSNALHEIFLKPETLQLMRKKAQEFENSPYNIDNYVNQILRAIRYVSN